VNETLQLTTLQTERDPWVQQNFPGDEMPHSLLGAVEELGELSHHYLKMQQGIRGDEQYHREQMADAVADCVIYLAGVCSWLGVDFGVLVQGTWDTVKMRDWVKYPTNGMSK
jgi:NTP pyrophosphatase (non-canonical NTP hydrolase)